MKVLSTASVKEILMTAVAVLLVVIAEILVNNNEFTLFTTAVRGHKHLMMKIAVRLLL